jgi:hypothetical protein
MRKSNFALRLQPSLLEEARKVAEAEGVALNQLINVAVAEKLSALRTGRYLAERAKRANISEALRILERAGVGQPPVKGDELPSGIDPAASTEKPLTVGKLWNPIQEHINGLSRGNMPAVHHYTTLKGALGILASGRMWFTERVHLNDPSELAHGIKIAERVLSGLGRKHDVERLQEAVKRVFQEFRFFSASFSFESNDISQWENYADHGRGVVLSFKATTFNNPKAHIDALIGGDATAVVCPMSYDTARLAVLIEPMIRLWNRSDISELCEHLFMISSMFKSGRWQPEREYRFFVHHKHEEILKSDFYATREQGGRLVSYLDLPIPNWSSRADFPIYRICLGPEAADGLDLQLMDFILARAIPIPREALSRSERDSTGRLCIRPQFVI